MNSLKVDINELVADWDVWSVVSTDENDKSITIQRSDEDQLIVIFKCPPNYPKGNLLLLNSHDKAFKASEGARAADALDEAIGQWVDEEGGMDAGYDKPNSSMLLDNIEGGGGGGGSVEVEINSAVLEQATKRIAQDAGHRDIAGQVHQWFDHSRRRFVVRLAVPLASFLSPFRAKALGLPNRSQSIVLELLWPWMYLEGTDVPECKDVYLLSPDHLKDREPRSLSRDVGALKWLFLNRMKQSFNKNSVHRERARLGISEAQNAEGMQNLAFSFPAENFYAHGNDNILAGALGCLSHRLATCTETCVICDAPLSMEGMKTAVCEKELCVHSSETYGLGSDVVSELKRDPKLCELLITLSYFAVNMGHSRDTFTPMCPTLLTQENYPDYKGPLHFYGNNFGSESKNFNLMKKTLDGLPKVSELLRLSKGSSDTLKAELDKKSPLTFPFLRWIFSSTRVHIEPIPKQHFIHGLGDHQFLLVSSNPQKEARFRLRREQMLRKKGKGSLWVWHGSQPGNWHCIIRMGLKNYSNTKFMSAGAACGPGIYTAKTMSTSLGYMGAPTGPWPGGEALKSASGCTLIALCELVNEDNNNGLVIHGNGSVITIQNEDLICTRFLFAYPDGFKGNGNIDGDNIKIPKPLLEMMDA